MREWNIRSYGVKADGISNDGPVIQQAVEDCSAAGGGRVTVPAGHYLCGTIELKDGVELHLEQGAVLLASLRPEDIHTTPHPDGSAEVSGYFVGAVHAKNVALTGQGCLNGQGWRVMTDDGADGGFHECPLMTEGFRPRLTYFEDVEDLTVRDVTFKDSALWTLHMAGCRRVRVESVKILNHPRGANNDGIDPDSCQDVLISDCLIETGDDAIVIKTTEPMTRKYGPCENIVIRGCILASHDSALKIGTETYGDIRNIILSDCIVRDCSRGVGIWVRDGAVIENIQVHHITGAVRRYANAGSRSFAPDWWGKGEPLFVSATRRKGKTAPAGMIRNLWFDHIRMTAESSIFIRGEEDSIIQNVELNDITVTMKKQGTQEAGFFDEQPSQRGVYPHEIPVIYAEYAHRLRIRSLTAYWDKDRQKAWAGLLETEHCTQVETGDLEEINL